MKISMFREALISVVHGIHAHEFQKLSNFQWVTQILVQNRKDSTVLEELINSVLGINLKEENKIPVCM